MLRQVVIIVTALSLVGCAHVRSKMNAHSTNPQCMGSKVVTSVEKKVGQFESVYVENNINVSLHSGYKHPKVILKGAASDLKNVFVSNHHGRLEVSVGEGFPKCGPVTAVIRGGHFSRFEYQGSGVVKGTKLNLSYLDLVIDNERGSTTLGGHVGVRSIKLTGEGPTTITGLDSPHLNLNLNGRTTLDLKGKANVGNIVVNDYARVKLYWANSKKLKIRGYGHANIQLAGLAQEMNLELCDMAHFNGRYLRASRAWVKTHGRSVAEIVADDRQHALASDTSDIYYYYLPDMGTDFLAFNGAVLDMRDLGLPYIQSYDMFNRYLQI